MRELYHSLSAEQRRAVCFDWDYRVDIQYARKPLYFADPKGVLLRTHMANAWKITPQLLASDFYTDAQRALVPEVMKTVLAPGWTEKLQQQATDDYGGDWGEDQAIAFFGAPDQEQTPYLPDSEPRFNVPLKKQIPIRQTPYLPDSEPRFNVPLKKQIPIRKAIKKDPAQDPKILPGDYIEVQGEL